MNRRKFLYLLYALTGLSVIAISLRCGHKNTTQKQATESDKWLNTRDSVHYVGMNTCRKCHSDIHASFVHTGMGMSFGRATRQKSAGNYGHHSPLYDKFSDLYYEPFFRDSVLMVKEYRLKGRDTIHQRTERIDYIIGSGHHTNSHILNRNGYLYQAPFTYYVQKGEWDLPPGFENGYNSRFNRSLGLECLSCHNAFPKFVEGSVNKYSLIPEGIDCERCHGPGSLHVQTKLAGKTVDIRHDTDFTIVNPRKLPYALQIDVCQRCHLQGDAVLKEGKTFFDFRPGMKLSSVMDVYLPAYEEDEKGFLMAAHAQRLKRSQCFLQSAKGKQQMTCISCHNPHVSVKFTKNEFFNQKCISCHPALDHKGVKDMKIDMASNCVKCHMPRSNSVDIPHVTITDHFIRVVKSKPKEYVPNVGKFKGLLCMNNDMPDAKSLARAYLYFYEKFEHKPYNLDSAYKYIITFKESEEPVLYIYYYFLKEDFQAISRIAGTVKKDFPEAVTYYQVGQAFMNEGKLNEALAWLGKAVSKEPFNLDYRLKLGMANLFAGNPAAAEKEFNFVLKENPDNAAALNDMGFLYLVQENAGRAKNYIGKSLALDPDYEPALINKAKLYLLENNKAEALKLLGAIGRKNPRNMDVQKLLEMINQKGL